MDTTDPHIRFNERGECNHCEEFLERTSKRLYQGKVSDQQLKTLVEKIKRDGKSKKYDAVLGLSGGIDSCYAAYHAKKLGLRVLAVHMDNGWNSEEAVKNIKNVADILDMDYESYVLNWDTFKDLQLTFLKASVPELETPTDIAIPAALHQIASRYGIKYIISGGNFATEGILPKSWHYNAKDVTYLKAIHQQFGNQSLKEFPLFGYKQEFYYKYLRGIRIIYLLNYLPYEKNTAMELLQKELQWKYYGGKHYESIYTGFVQSYILPEKFFIDYRKATFSTQICVGSMKREEALHLLQSSPYENANMEKEKAYVCKKLGITVEEFNRMMQEQPLTHRHYPNDENLLEWIYGWYRKLNG